jgi:hypothetical protein
MVYKYSNILGTLLVRIGLALTYSQNYYSQSGSSNQFYLQYGFDQFCFPNNFLTQQVAQKPRFPYRQLFTYIQIL